MNIPARHVKPTTRPGATIPIPTLVLNTGEDDVEVQSSSDEDDAGLEPTNPDSEDDECDAGEPTETTELVKRALLKCAKVVSLICSSSSRGAWFNTRAKLQGFKSIIYGWGVRWNAEADSQRRAAAGYEIINGMLHTDSKTNHFFRGLSISEEEWNAVRSVNKVLEVFERATKRMEGNFDSGCKILSEYCKVQSELLVLKRDSTYPSLDGMITEMLKHLKQYADEAAETEVVQMATILNPRHRMNYITKFYPDVGFQAQHSIDTLFTQYAAEMPQPRAPLVEIITENQADGSDDEDDQFPAGPATETIQDVQVELKHYLEGANPIGKGTSALDWCASNKKAFPVLDTMAQDCLSLPGTSCAVERTFSSAADIAVSSRGSMKPSAVSQSVACREWLKNKAVPPGKFQEAVTYLLDHEFQEVKKKDKQI